MAWSRLNKLFAHLCCCARPTTSNDDLGPLCEKGFDPPAEVLVTGKPTYTVPYNRSAWGGWNGPLVSIQFAGQESAAAQICSRECSQAAKAPGKQNPVGNTPLVDKGTMTLPQGPEVSKILQERVFDSAASAGALLWGPFTPSSHEDLNGADAPLVDRLKCYAYK